MNKKIFLPFLAFGAMAALTGCDENAWNDKLDGFDDTFKPTQVETIEYTLTDADYATIAGNKTNKEIAEKAGDAQALAALSGNKYFTEKIDAATYVPAFLASKYYTFTNGSSVRLTYNNSVGMPEAVTESAGATLTTVGTDFYQASVWESDDNYIDGFAPEKPASRFLPAYLKEALPDAEANAYALVSYQEASVNPVFGNVGGGDTPAFELSDVIGDIAAGDGAEINGVVGGVCGCGFVLTDNSGSIFVYCGNGFDRNLYPIGTQMTLVGEATSYKGNLQIAAGAEITVVGTQEYTFPAPVVLDGAALDAVLSRPADQTAVYAQISGKVVVSGNNINIEVAGAETAKGSVYYASDEQKALLTDGSNWTITGWFISISGSRYCNFVIDKMEQAAAGIPAKMGARTVAAPVPTVTKYALYQFDGSKWAVPAGFAVLQSADYTAMGMTSDRLSNAANYLPAYLKNAFPYAADDDEKYVIYIGSNGSAACDDYKFNGSEWIQFKGVVTETSQFVMAEGKWMFDPNVTITLPYGKGQTYSATYYQACVDWVYENKCVPLGDTSIKSGKFWVTSYGNNDYYCGASAYQNNIDLRAASARNQYPAGFEGMTDKEVVHFMEDNFTNEVFPAVLSQFYPEAKPIAGMKVIYTLNFYAYNGSKTLPCKAEFEVVGPAKFECISAEWLIGMEPDPDNF